MSTDIEALYDKARRGLAQQEAGGWDAAEAMAELYRQGQSHREIAARLGCSRSTVSYYVRAYSALGASTERPSLSEAVAAMRDYSQRVPKAPEKRAELAAELLKDKAIYETPAVRETVRRHSEREVRQAAATWNREHDMPTRTQTDREWRITSPTAKGMFWTGFLQALQYATRKINDATGELERTGLPNKYSGDIVRAVRALGRAADRFADAAANRAVGSPIDQTNAS